MREEFSERRQHPQPLQSQFGDYGGRKLQWIGCSSSSSERKLSPDSSGANSEQQSCVRRGASAAGRSYSFKMGISKRTFRVSATAEQVTSLSSHQDRDANSESGDAFADSKDLRHQQMLHAVATGNSVLIRFLHDAGASLECLNSEGMTPLMLACSQERLFTIVPLLLNLGAILTAYRAGPHGGHALHHASVAGLANTVAVLLSYGANPLLSNDDGQTALDIARERKHVAVVRVIEDRICYFRGYLREMHLNPDKATSKKMWIVVLPTCSTPTGTLARNELVMYASKKSAKPRRVILLGKFTCEIQVPDFSKPNPSLVIIDKVTKSTCRLRSNVKGDIEELRAFYEALQGQSTYDTNRHLPETQHLS